ncbi:sensor histidine kinase [Nocardia puris]|uniref:sensor histidine kinase n=1 Tax=Nocardia puris TaxID=208602 RepID=UPI002E22BE19
MFYLILLSGDIIRQAAAVATWWTVFAVPAVFGPPIAFGLLSFRRDLAPMRMMARIGAILFVVAAVTWPLAWNGTLLERDAWISMFPGLAGLSAALAWPPRWTIALLATAVVPVQLINHYCRVPELDGRLIPDMMFALAFCLIYVAAALMAMRTGRLLDQTRAAAHLAAAGAAATQARDVQRARFNALMHDWVMSTLLATSRRTDRTEVRRQAELTLAKLDELEPDDTRDYTEAELAAHLRTAISDVDDSLTVQVRGSGEADGMFPADPVHVLGAAAAEAVRNSVRHAGPDATRTVSLDIRAGRIELTIADDGAGFDPSAVPPHRLGLAASIIGRMRQLPGGAVELETGPGAGTRIRMSWQDNSR